MASQNFKKSLLKLGCCMENHTQESKVISLEAYNISVETLIFFVMHS